MNTLIKTINESVGIREPSLTDRTNFLRYMDLVYAFDPDVNGNTFDPRPPRSPLLFKQRHYQTYKNLIMGVADEEWRKRDIKDRYSKQYEGYYTLNTKSGLKRLGKDKAVAELFAKKITPRKYKALDFDSLELQQTIHQAFYLKKIIEYGYSLTSKLEPRLHEIMDKFNSGDWQKIDWDKLSLPDHSTRLYSDIKIIDHPLFQTRLANGEIKYHDPREVNLRGRFSFLHNLHQVHFSLTNPIMIAYYPTLTHLRQGREVITKLGRYLTKYQNFLGIDNNLIKVLTDKHNAIVKSMNSWDIEFVDSRDKQGWAKGYYGRNNHVSSCMSKDYTQMAVQAYAHEKSVLRLALLKGIDGDEHCILARCIVRDDDNKGYVRVYPDPNSNPEGRFLLDYLKDLGYTKQVDMDGVLLDGVLSEEMTDDYGYDIYYAPYIDGECKFADVVELENEDGTEHTYLKILEEDGGDFELNLTNGYSSEIDSDEDHGYCTDCDSREHIDDLRYIENHGDVCEYCIEQNYIWVSCEDSYYYQDDVIYCETDGEYYPHHTHENHDIYFDEHDETYYHLDEMRKVQGIDSQIYYYHDSNCVKLFILCGEGLEYAYYKDAIELPDGDIIHKNDLVQFGYVEEWKE